MRADRLHGRRCALALAATLLLAAAPAAAAERHWTFIGGCSNADWRGVVSGSNAEGRATCWAATAGGLSGALPPNAGDDVFIVASSSADLLVAYAAAGRPPYAGVARDLLLDSTGATGGTGAVGLTFASTLGVTTTLGLQGNLFVGVNGRGRLEQAGGGLSVAGVALLGSAAGSDGEMRLSGGTLAVTGSFEIGRNGAGWLMMSGGTADLGTLSLGTRSGGQGHVQVTDATLTSSTVALVGSAVGASGTVTLSGPGARWTNTGSLAVGTQGSGGVAVIGGAQMSSANASLGLINSTSLGTVTLNGAGTRWDNAGLVQLGGEGRGAITVGSGAVFRSASLLVGTNGTLVLDGGEVVLDQGSLGNGLDWRSGTLRIAAPGGAIAGGGLLASLAPLRAGQALVIDGPLLVGAGVLALSGGTLRAGSVGLDGGVLAASNGSVIDVSTLGLPYGQGTVAGPIRGGSGARIETQLGVLTLGSANQTDGFMYDGRLTANARQIVLLDRDEAQLGGFTELLAGGSLAAPNGLLLDTGRSLVFNGNASIEGPFTHRGSISRLGGGTAVLTFFDDVSGPGSFSGNIVFKGVYSPGGASAAAAVGFGGGSLEVGSSGVLQFDIDSAGADRLTGIGALSFAGALQLDFAAGTVLPAGSVIRLFEFGSFSGAFDPARIGVSGVDPGRLDFSRLALDGSVAVVPEPGAAGLMALGALAVMPVVARRRHIERNAT